MSNGKVCDGWDRDFRGGFGEAQVDCSIVIHHQVKQGCICLFWMGFDVERKLGMAS